MDKKNSTQTTNNNQKLSLASFIRDNISYIHAAQEQGFKLEIIYQALKNLAPLELSYNTFAVQLYRHRKTLKANGQDVEILNLNQNQINDLQVLQAKQAKLVKTNLKNKVITSKPTNVQSNKTKQTNKQSNLKNTEIEQTKNQDDLELPINLAQIQAIQQAMMDLQNKQTQLNTATVTAVMKDEINKTENNTTKANNQTDTNHNNVVKQGNLVKEIRSIFKQGTDIADLI